MTLRIIIPGRPQRWQRPENRKGGGRRTQDEHRAAKRMIQLLARVAMDRQEFDRIQGDPVRVDRVYVYPRTKEKPPFVPKEVWATGCRVLRPFRPDIDNMDKLLFDALNKIVYRDDALVCAGRAIKVYAADGEEPHTEVTISRAGWLVEDTCD